MEQKAKEKQHNQKERQGRSGKENYTKLKGNHQRANNQAERWIRNQEKKDKEPRLKSLGPAGYRRGQEEPTSPTYHSELGKTADE